MSRFEIQARSNGFVHVGGIDEAGRGHSRRALLLQACGPSRRLFYRIFKGFKKLASVRDRPFDIIINEAVDYGIGTITPEEIDQINIFNATKKAMIHAVGKLKKKPDFF